MGASLIKRLGVNELGRDFVIGDLHGAHACLERALAGVNFDPATDRLISVGDLIDRGNESERCLRLLEEPWFHSVLGNHEQMMLNFFEGRPGGEFWISNGGGWALEHLTGQGQPAPPLRRALELVAALPLLITVELGPSRRFHVLHAELAGPGALTDEGLTSATSAEFCAAAFAKTMDGDYITWGRYIFYDLSTAPLGERAVERHRQRAKINKLGDFFNPELSMIYSGHTIMRGQPARFRGQTNVDTGAYLSLLTPAPAGGDETSWPGLTITEPLTDRFWKATPTSFEEVQLVKLE